MRKKSKYRPKPVLANPVAYVVESLTPVAQHGQYLLDLKIKNHAAMTLLTQGNATRQDIDTLIQMANVCEALYRMGFGLEYEGVVKRGMDALFDVGYRGRDTNRFILKAVEMAALNELMELHDAQLEITVVKDLENAIKLVRREFAAKRMRNIASKLQKQTNPKERDDNVSTETSSR